MTIKSRRNVIESGRVPKGGRPKLWAYGYQDLADLFEVEVQTVRKWCTQGRLDPERLETICKVWHDRACKRSEDCPRALASTGFEGHPHPLPLSEAPTEDEPRDIEL